MASTTTELIDNGTKVDGRGRRITRAQERQALIAAYRSSGMTQRVFAQREGVKYSTFTSWLQGRRRATATATKASFTEVAIAPALSSPALSVQLPDGTLITGRCAREMVELVHALRGSKRC
jgi:DNA-binding transcriptional regulator YiaG